MRDVLIDFRHGLGDAVQLTSVIKHIRHYHPNWNVDVSAFLGKHSVFTGLCRTVHIRDQNDVDHAQYQDVFSLAWDECFQGYSDWPSTKTTRCLLEVFALTPIPGLCTYEIQAGNEAQRSARDYLRHICNAPPTEGRYPVVLIHYEGNTSGDQKNLPHDIARDLCDVAISSCCTPVILDWDRRSPLPDGKVVFNPGAGHTIWNGHGTGDAEVLSALISASRLMIGVDSGPLHVAGATTTPTIGVWTGHHPVHYFDLASNILHFVPANHEQLAHGQAALAYFSKSYRHNTYRQLAVDLPAYAESVLTGEDFQVIANRRYLKRLSSTVYDRQYYEEHKLAGLDYLGFGDWQKQYGRWLIQCLGLKGKRVLDVGCACGAILRGLGEAGAVVQGVDLNEHMIQLGRNHWPDMADLLFVCDAVNLHLFADQSWDAVHTAQVAEHWKPELVPLILRELARIVVPHGIWFCALDTAELIVRQNRQMQDEDPTHVCIRSKSWWREQLHGTGWRDCSTEFEDHLRQHPHSFLSRYDWDWFVARREASGA